jgi:4'-phosphopantetheinyl transferase EntD
MLPTLFESGARVHGATATDADASLTPEELHHIRNAVAGRRAEFGTARVLVRRALAELGLPAASVVPGKDRAPVWPAGVTGSITHSRGYCAVVVAKSPPVRAIGLDVETRRPLEARVVEKILTPGERAWLAGRAEESRNELALLVFSAKEAYYKCQYTLTTRFLGFQDVEIDADLDAQRFEARALVPGLPAEVMRLAGRFAFDAEKVTCGVELLAGSPVGA